jgi:lipopolysaccharide biosynthesis glycosyltransferase
MMLTSAKSLLRYCPPVALVLHDDGSLTDDDQAQLRKHLPGANIIRRGDADAVMRTVLPKAVFDKRQKHLFLLKLFDFNHFNRGTHTLLLDSDILFLQEPTEVIAWMRDPEPVPFYNKDHCPSYRASRVPEGVELPQCLNAGFMGFKSRLDLHEIARWAFDLDYWLEDQTIYAVLLANQGALALDPERYRVWMGEHITSRTAMVHFISPKRFHRLAYPRLARRVYRQLRVAP